MALTAAHVLNAISGAPLPRALAAALSVKCEECGRELVHSALLALVGDCECRRCSRKASLVASVARATLAALGLNPFEASVLLEEPWLRRLLVNEVKGVALFGRRKPQVPAAPVIAIYEITNECNARCIYCHVDARSKLPGELTLTEKLELIDQLAECGTVALMVAGGEPLMSPDLEAVIRRAKKGGMYTVVITNGSLLTLTRAASLRNAGLDYVKVSLDGASPEVHDSLRGEGSWEAAIKGLKNAVDAGIPYVGVATTLTRKSAEEVPKLVRLAKELGAKRMNLFNFVPSGRAASVRSLDLDGELRERVLRWALAETRKFMLGEGGFEISTTAPQGPRIAKEVVLSKIPRRALLKAIMRLTPYGRIQALAGLLSEGCSAGVTVVSITSDGRVKPCDLMPVTVGSVREASFWEIWLRSPTLAVLRDRKNIEGWCASCRYLHSCGGCRSRAYAYFGSLTAPDPMCALAPAASVGTT